MIEIRGLTKRFGNVVAVKDLTLDVGRGQLFGFLGPNGAGKTTTIRILCGVLKPTQGTATIAGHSVVDDSVEVKRHVGYLAEEPYLYDKLTPAEFLQFIGDIHALNADVTKSRSARLLAALGLEDKADEIVEGLSRGMRQKLGLAAALLHDPDVLLLDEPTSGLDPRSARLVKDLLTDLAIRGKAVFVSTHLLEIAERMCDRVAIIDRGELIAEGTLEQLRRQARAGQASLEDLFLKLTGGPEEHQLSAIFGGE